MTLNHEPYKKPISSAKNSVLYPPYCQNNIVLTVLATRKFVLVTKSENLGATWPQGFYLKVEP